MENRSEYGRQKMLTISACRILPNTAFDVSDNLRVLYVVKGEVSIQFTSGAKKLFRDDVEIIGIHEPVRLFSQENNAVLFFTVDGDFAKRRCDRIDRMILNCNFDFIFPSQVDGERLDRLRSLLRELFSRYMRADPSLNDGVEQLIQLLVEHFDSYSNVLNHIPNEDIHKARFNSINTYIIDNLNDKIRLSDLVGQEHVSSQYLSKEFKKKYGISFSELLSYYRIIHSVRLLTNTKLGLAEVSEQCGFSATRYYYKYFKKFLGMSPSEFRLRLVDRTSNLPASADLDLERIWEEYGRADGRLLWVLPPVEEEICASLLRRLETTALGSGTEAIALGAEEEEDLWIRRIRERESGLEGIVLVGLPPHTARRLRQEVSVPVADLWEAAECFLRLSGISFEPLRDEIGRASLRGDVAGLLKRRMEGGALPQVFLLEEPALLPQWWALGERSALPLTDGIDEGLLMLGALWGEEGKRLRDGLRPRGAD